MKEMCAPGLHLAAERKQDEGSLEHLTACHSSGAVSNLCAWRPAGFGFEQTPLSHNSHPVLVARRVIAGAWVGCESGHPTLSCRGTGTAREVGVGQKSNRGLAGGLLATFSSTAG